MLRLPAPLLLLFALLGLPWATRAQQPLVPARPLGSLSPADTASAELDFLRREIGGARVVLLGEPTHGEGNVLAAKARLVAYLQQHLGFTTLAMESGFFSLHKAQQEIAAGKSVSKNLQASIFPVWMATQEFQAVLPLVGGAGGLRVMGFDSQLSGDYSDDLTDDLEDFVENEPGAEAVNFDLLDDVHGHMAARFAFPATTTLAAYEAELAKVPPLLARAARAAQPARRQQAAFWQQCVRSLLALARDYARHDLSAKTAATLVAADGNPRDAQMADNLLWYLREHPAEKLICWGALPHFANRVEVLENEELQAYHPMGRAVRAALGPGQVYILGTLAGGGTHGVASTAGVPVPPPAPGTLEASLLAAVATPAAFVSLKHDAPGQQLTTYAFDYQPVAGPWSEVVDGFLFFRRVEPPHLLARDSTAAPPDSTTLALAAAPPGSLSPVSGQGGPVLRRPVAVADVSGVRPVRGVVLDQRTGQPVPYAAVQLPGLGRGTVADGQGRLLLALPGPTPLRVSSLGYAASTVRSPTGTDELTVLLAPAAYALAARPLPTAESILQSVVKNIPRNYEQQAYAAEVYTYRRTISFDSIQLEQESVSHVRVPAGYHSYAPAAGKGGVYQQLLQQHILRQSGDSARFAGGLRYARTQATGLAAADPVRVAPLFRGRGAKRFGLKLDSVRVRGTDTLYVLSFVARPADERSTGLYAVGSYQGRLVVQARDYAVLRFEALWRQDTAAANRPARRPGHAARPAALVAFDHEAQVATYAKAASGRYYVRRASSQSAVAGRVPAGVPGQGSFNAQELVERAFTPLPAAGPPPPPTPKGLPPLPPPPYRPEFWNTYQRPDLR